MTITSMKFKNDSYCSVREALKKKKVKFFYNLGGRGLADKILHFKKLCLKCFLGYSEPFW